MLILQGHTDAVRCLSYSPDGRWLASGSEDKTVRLWDLTSHAPAIVKHESSVEVLAFYPQGDMLATGTAVGELLVWDVLRRRRRFHAKAHAGGVRAMAFTADGQTLTTTGWDRIVKRWDTNPLKQRWFDAAGNRTTQVEGQFRLHELACSPDGRQLVCGDADGTITLWQGNQFHATLRGHTWTIYALAFTPDSRTLLSGSADGTVRLWDTATGRERRCYRWHKSWVTCVAVAPDGMTAAAGSADHTVVIWDLDDD